MPGKPFKPSLMFVGKARANPITAPFRCYTLGKAPGLAQKHYTRLEKLAREQTLYKNSLITTIKSFIGLTPGAPGIKKKSSITLAKKISL